MALVLTLRGSPGSATPAELRLEQGEAVLGRGAGAHMQFVSPTVSRRHCTVSGQGGQWRIADASISGTLVNGQRVAGAWPLRDGDVVTIGDSELVVAIGDGRPPAQPAPGGGAMWPAAAAPVTARGWGDAAAHPAAAQDPVSRLLAGAGVARGAVAASDDQIITAAGAALRASVAGLSGLLAERRKARRDLGVEEGATPLESGGGPEQMLAQLLAGAQGQAGVAAAFDALAAHQHATRDAMQAAFFAVLDQFAPEAIKRRTNGDAAAWRAYEQAFAAKDGFVELFRQELAERYRTAKKHP